MLVVMQSKIIKLLKKEEKYIQENMIMIDFLFVGMLP